MTDPALHKEIWRTLSDGRPVAVTSHVRLDGDGAGSCLALRHALRRVGADCRCVFQPPMPPMFDFLPGMDECCGSVDSLPAEYHLVIVDCGHPGRVGPIGEEFNGAVDTTNIDHHDTNTRFGDLNYVDPDASSCGEMMRRLLRSAEQPLTLEIAECLFTAVVHDTGRFSHQDTSPEAFTVCGECVAAGVRPDELMQNIFLSPTPAQVRLQQRAMATLEFHADGRIATMAVTERMFRETGLRPVDTEGFAEIPISIRGVQASALLKEMADCGYIKVSMRSKGEVDVCAVAGEFGGGGHTHAAGCEISEPIEAVRRAIVEALQNRLRAHAG